MDLCYVQIVHKWANICNYNENLYGLQGGAFIKKTSPYVIFFCYNTECHAPVHKSRKINV